MTLSVEKIEALALDQSSLAAARKLVNPAKWSSLVQDGHNLVWGEWPGLVSDVVVEIGCELRVGLGLEVGVAGRKGRTHPQKPG